MASQFSIIAKKKKKKTPVAAFKDIAVIGSREQGIAATFYSQSSYNTSNQIETQKNKKKRTVKYTEKNEKNFQ